MSFSGIRSRRWSGRGVDAADDLDLRYDGIRSVSMAATLTAPTNEWPVADLAW
jgi:hypothetical protein